MASCVAISPSPAKSKPPECSSMKEMDTQIQAIAACLDQRLISVESECSALWTALKASEATAPSPPVTPSKDDNAPGGWRDLLSAERISLEEDQSFLDHTLAQLEAVFTFDPAAHPIPASPTAALSTPVAKSPALMLSPDEDQENSPAPSPCKQERRHSKGSQWEWLQRSKVINERMKSQEVYDRVQRRVLNSLNRGGHQSSCLPLISATAGDSQEPAPQPKQPAKPRSPAKQSWVLGAHCICYTLSHCLYVADPFSTHPFSLSSSCTLHPKQQRPDSSREEKHWNT